MEMLWQRARIKNESFAIIAVLMLALGGGAMTALTSAHWQIGQAERGLASGSDQPPQITSLQVYWDDFFARALKPSVVGYSYAIYQQGKPVAVGAYGYAVAPNKIQQAGVPMRPSTRMQIASVSKPMTAVALLHEMERKGISPEAKLWPLLRATFPDLTEPGRGIAEITIADLLSHTSGFPFGYVYSPRLKNLRELFANPLPKPPGKERVYSNINYSIARTLLEALSGRDYEQYVREEILRPAGSAEMRLQAAEAQVADAYSLGEAEGAPLALDFRDEAGAYGWYATVEEVARFLAKVRAHAYLSPEMNKQMLEQGLGWTSQATLAGPAYRHDGQWVLERKRGVQTGLALLPDGVEAVLFINTNGGFSPSSLLLRGFNENVPRLSTYNPAEASVRVIRVEVPSHAHEVRCTTDGSLPSRSAALYRQPIHVGLSATVQCQGFASGNPVTFVNTVKLQ